MIKKLVVVASGGALAFALAGVANAGVASASAHPASVAHAKLLLPAAPPTIRDSTARPGHPKIQAQAAPPTIRDSIVRGGDPPVITHLNTQTGDPDDGGQIF